MILGEEFKRLLFYQRLVCMFWHILILREFCAYITHRISSSNNNVRRYIIYGSGMNESYSV